MLRAPDAFALRLADGRELPGHLVGGRKVWHVAKLIGERVVVFADGHFGPGGELVAVEADGLLELDPLRPTHDMYFRRTPDEVAELRSRIPHVEGPEEDDGLTDEEVNRLVKRMG